MNKTKLFELLADSYKQYDTSPEAQPIGLAYVREFHNRLGVNSPELKENWDKFLATPAGEREQDYLDDAGCFLALMDTMKLLWEDAYQSEVEKAVLTDPTLRQPEPYHLPRKGKILQIIKALFSVTTFISSLIFVTILVAVSFVNIGFTSQQALITLGVTMLGATGWVVTSWLWRKHYGVQVKKAYEAFETYMLLWRAKFGAVPTVSGEKIVIPSPPFSWVKDSGQDIVKYAEVTEYLKDKFINPYNEKHNLPELTLPEISSKELPVVKLNELKKYFQQHLN